MNALELAQKLADHYGLPVKVCSARECGDLLVRIEQNPTLIIARDGTIHKKTKGKKARLVGSSSYSQHPVRKNPAEYQQTDHSLILRSNPRKPKPLPRKLISQDWVLRETRQSSLEGVPISKIEPEKQAELKDSFIVGLKKTRPIPKVKINSPEDVTKFLGHVTDYDRERAKIIHLDTKNQIVGVENISTGSLNASIVHPRETVKGAILNNSNAVIFVHNHPSGNPEPSKEDRDVHRKLKNAFGTVGIELLDSIVIGREGYRSLREEGL